MDVNKTPVFDAMKSLFLPYRDVWQQQPVEKASSSRLKYSEIDTRFPLAPQDCIAMWIADMDIAPSRDIVEGVADYIKQSVGYQAMSIGKAVSTWFNNQNAGVVAGSTQILPEHVVGVASVIGAVNLALSIWCEPGDSVMVCTPTYGPLLEAATLNNLCVEKVSLLNGEIDPSSLSPSASAMVLCHPNNPDGAVLSDECQATLITFCQQHNIVLITDEVHAELGFNDINNPSAIPLFGASVNMAMSPCLVHISSVNKAFNLASLPGASFAIIPDPSKRKAFIKHTSQRHLDASYMSQHALLSAYLLGETWLNTTRHAIAFNRQLVTRFFEYHQINANATMGQAGFFLWINLREAASCEGENAKHFSPAQSAGTCISRGVIGNDGSQFDAIGHIRLNLACHPLHVERALNRLYFLD